MKKKSYLTSLLSLVIGISPFLSLSASTAQVSAPEYATDTQQHKEQPAWLLESIQAAREYVDAIDKGEYAKSWAKGDPVFRRTIDEDVWVKTLNEYRKPLGKVQSRTLDEQRIAWDPKGLPKGVYMVVIYKTVFAQSPDGGELVTLRRDSDGVWRVLTYEIGKQK